MIGDILTALATSGTDPVLLQLGRHDFAERLDTYASDVDALDRCAHIAGMTEALIVGNVLGERLLAALRRLAQIHHLRARVPWRLQPGAAATPHVGAQAPGVRTDSGASQ